MEEGRREGDRGRGWRDGEGGKVTEEGWREGVGGQRCLMVQCRWLMFCVHAKILQHTCELAVQSYSKKDFRMRHFAVHIFSVHSAKGFARSPYKGMYHMYVSDIITITNLPLSETLLNPKNVQIPRDMVREAVTVRNAVSPRPNLDLTRSILPRVNGM